jgi:hypothetical protein
MDSSVPGFVPKVLSETTTVGLFRADERVFNAMLDGWRAQMLARGLTTGLAPSTIAAAWCVASRSSPASSHGCGDRGLRGLLQRVRTARSLL